MWVNISKFVPRIIYSLTIIRDYRNVFLLLNNFVLSVLPKRSTSRSRRRSRCSNCSFSIPQLPSSTSYFLPCPLFFAVHTERFVRQLRAVRSIRQMYLRHAVTFQRNTNAILPRNRTIQCNRIFLFRRIFVKYLLVQWTRYLIYCTKYPSMKSQLAIKLTATSIMNFLILADIESFFMKLTLLSFTFLY